MRPRCPAFLARMLRASRTVTLRLPGAQCTHVACNKKRPGEKQGYRVCFHLADRA